MSYSKRQFVLAALTELGIATRGTQLTADEALDGGTRLDAMMAEWDSQGLHLGYPITSEPSETNLDTPTAVPPWANSAVICNLALQLGPMYGKEALPSTKMTAKSALSTVRGRMGPPPSMQLPGTMPAGSGNKPWLWENGPFISQPVDNINVDTDSDLDFD